MCPLAQVLVDPMKRCGACQERFEGTPEYFHADRSKRDGLSSTCKVCAKRRTQLWTQNHQAQKKDTGKAYRKKNRERLRPYFHQYWLVNLEHLLKYHADYRQRHSTKRVRYAAEWNKQHPLKMSEHRHRRRARVRSAEGVLSALDIQKQFDGQKGRCWWCRKKFMGSAFHVDHVIPLARGGTNDAKNICIACPACNVKKGAKLPSEFAGRLF